MATMRPTRTVSPKRGGVHEIDAATQAELQCVCDMCTCGHHPCPAHPERRPPTAPFLGTTTYRDVFCALEDKRAPVPERGPAARGEATTHSAHYPGWPVSVAVPSAQVDTTGAPSVRLDATHKEAFPEHPLPQRQMYLTARAPQPRNNIVFRGTSETRSKFPGHAPGPIVVPRAEARPPTAFEGTTTYRATHNATAQALETLRPAETGLAAPAPSYEPLEAPPPAPFEGSTVYQDEFVPKPTDRRPRRAPQPPMPPSGPGSWDTEHMREYQPKAAPPCPVVLLPPAPASLLLAASMGGSASRPEHGSHLVFDKTNGKWVTG